MIGARRAASPHAQSPHRLRLTLQADQGTTDASILIAISAHRTSARAIFSPQILEKSHGLAQRMRLERQLGDARAVARLMPPVGQKLTWPNGLAQALSKGMPPAASAGKSLRNENPSASAAMISLDVATPGRSGKFRPLQAPPTSEA